MGRSPSFSFLSRRHATIISCPSGWAGFFGLYVAKSELSRHYGKVISGLGTMSVFHFEMSLSINYCFYMCREHVLGISNTEFTGQDVGLIPQVFYYLGARLMLLLHGFVAQQACLVLWLSKPAFFFFLTNIFIWLFLVLVLAYLIFDLHCSMWEF